jgi:hypothetical protein
MVHSPEQDEDYASLTGLGPRLAERARDVTRGILVALSAYT